MHIGILSSSFLYPGNQAWQKINVKKTFCELGDYKILQERNKFNFIVLVLFITDFNNEKGNKINNFYPLIKLLEKRAKQKNLGTLVMVSSYKKNNLIKINNNFSKEKEIKQKLLKKFFNIKKNNSNFNFSDLDEIFSTIGYQNAFDSRNKYLTSSNLSQLGIDELNNFLSIFFKRYSKPKSKILVLDCDNTLWGGVLGEEGIDKIEIGESQTGRIYLDFQKEILNLYNQGVLLAISSKNNEEDVLDVLKNHPSIILKKKHFVNFKINWDLKSKNINKIAEELDLGLDSFVFWDDNPLERNLVRKILPEVFTVEPNEDIVYWPEQIASLENFSNLSNVSLKNNKTKKYHARAKFINDKESARDELKYLKSIKLKTKISTLNKNNIARASEMTLKTNQYNLRTERYVLPDIEKIMKDKKYVGLLIGLKDIYADHGNVGLVILKRIDKNTLFLDTFLMSCRVIGRYFETRIFSYIKEYALKNKYKSILGEFIDTKKNIVAKKLLEDHGFKKISHKTKKNSHMYSCKIKDIKQKNVDLYD